jgi:hypothetical protein
MTISMVLIVCVQTLIATGLGMFFAQERRTAGVSQDWKALGLAGALSAITGFIIAEITTPPAFDYMVVMGIISFAAALLGRDIVGNVSARCFHHKDTHTPASIDFMCLACTMWAGAACGIGDLRGCIFVALVMAMVAVSRSQSVEKESSRVPGEKSGMALPVEPEIMQFRVPVHAPTLAQVRARPVLLSAESARIQTSEQTSGHGAAHGELNTLYQSVEQLTQLAQILRQAGQGKTSTGAKPANTIANSMASGGLQPAMARRSEYLPHHNVAARQWAGQGQPSIRRGRRISEIQRCNHAIR